MDAESEILTQTVGSYREQVRILSAQLEQGLVSPLAVSQARAQLDIAMAQSRDLERARADEEHAIAILCGRAAPSFAVAVNPLREASPPLVPAGVPGGGWNPPAAVASRS